MRRASSLLLGLVVLAGCSGGGDGDDRLSKDEYVERADAVCADYDKRLGDLPDPGSIAALGPLTRRALPIAREAVAQLRELRPPEDLQARVNEWLKLNVLNVRRIEELGNAARAGDRVRVQEIARDAAANEREADRLARELGLETCAQGEG